MIAHLPNILVTFAIFTNSLGHISGQNVNPKYNNVY